MAIYIIRKRVKNDLELEFLEKIIKGLVIFKKFPELF
jgi:hypothetical protein